MGNSHLRTIILWSVPKAKLQVCFIRVQINLEKPPTFMGQEVTTTAVSDSFLYHPSLSVSKYANAHTHASTQTRTQPCKQHMEKSNHYQE